MLWPVNYIQYGTRWILKMIWFQYQYHFRFHLKRKKKEKKTEAKRWFSFYEWEYLNAAYTINHANELNICLMIFKYTQIFCNMYICIWFFIYGCTSRAVFTILYILFLFSFTWDAGIFKFQISIFCLLFFFFFAV